MGGNSNEVNRRSVLQALSGAGLAIAGTGAGLAATDPSVSSSDIGILPYEGCETQETSGPKCDTLIPDATYPVWSVMDYTVTESDAYKQKRSQQVLSYFGTGYDTESDKWVHRFALQGHYIKSDHVVDHDWHAINYTCPIDNVEETDTKNRAAIEIEGEDATLKVDENQDTLGFYDYDTFVNHYEQEHGELEDPRIGTGCSPINSLDDYDKNDFFYDKPSPFSEEESRAFRSLHDPDIPNEPLTDSALEITDAVQANSPVLQNPDGDDDINLDMMLATVGMVGTGVSLAAPPPYGAAVSVGLSIIDMIAGVDWDEENPEEVTRPGGDNDWGPVGYEPDTIGTPAGHFVHFEVELEPTTDGEPTDVTVQSMLLDEEHSMTISLQPLGQPDRAPHSNLDGYSFSRNDAAIPPSDGVYDVFERPDGGTDPIIEEIHCPSRVVTGEEFECSAVINSASTRDINYYGWGREHFGEGDIEEKNKKWCGTTDTIVPNWERCGINVPGEVEITLVVGDEAGLFDYKTTTVLVGEPEGETLPIGDPGALTLGTSEASGMTVPTGSIQGVEA
ncbi:hypothetical protein [Halovivax cerinus]|uniref:Uncharacterized protein n=1 Tax=Halovivax cerinus TaxID=1487865 RepID=A0ABD5NK72_9EURY|nr:hypothetical protein [Halovivax cerinus]